MPLRLIASIAGLIIGLGALLLQFSLTIPARMANGANLPGAVVYFFTFYTILTNVMLVLVYLSDLVAWPWLRWWRSPVTRGMMTGAITLVCLFYHFVLSGTWAPQAWFKVADVALHYVTPAYYVLWWLVFQPKGDLTLRHVPVMLLPTGIWLGWTMLRGALVNDYPYPILEANKLGYGAVTINCLGVLGTLVLFLLIVIFIDTVMGRRSAKAA